MKILNTNIRLDGNHLYKLELTVDELPTTDETVLLEDEEQKYVYGETPDGYVTYGCMLRMHIMGMSLDIDGLLVHLYLTVCSENVVWK